MKELKTTWAPLWDCYMSEKLAQRRSGFEGGNIPGLGKSHPQDEYELEEVVEGCNIFVSIHILQ